MVVLAREVALAIAGAAILAPSAENKHGFEIEIADDGIALIAKPEFLSAPFHRRVLGLMGLGASVENMRIAALSRGLAIRCSWFPRGPHGEELVTVRFYPAECAVNTLASAISRRHTNRNLRFRGPPLSQSVRHSIAESIRDIEGVELTWLNEPDRRRDALKLLWLAETHRFSVKPLHAELFGSIRFDLGWRRPAEEGLAPGTLGIEAMARPGFAALRHWRIVKALNVLGAARLLGFRAAYLPCALAPELAAISTSSNLEEGAIAGGQALERVWLTVTSKHLAMQPFAAPTLLALTGYTDVPVAIGGRLRRGWETLVPGQTPLIVLRLGCARPPAFTNARRSIDHYLRAGERNRPI
jgi:hypothetical protein